MLLTNLKTSRSAPLYSFEEKLYRITSTRMGTTYYVCFKCSKGRVLSDCHGVVTKSIPCTIQCSINAAEQNALFAVQEGKVYAAQHPGIFVYFLC